LFFARHVVKIRGAQISFSFGYVMPLHNWNQVEAEIFHAFHTAWIGEIQSALNRGLLPVDYYALAEQHAGGFVADVLALRLPTNPAAFDLNESTSTDSDSLGTTQSAESAGPTIGSSLLMELPQTSVHETIDLNLTELRRTIAIRHVSNHKIVALIEIVSPANKDRQDSINDFVDKTIRALSRGIHVLIVDILASGNFDPGGLHRTIRSAVTEEGQSITGLSPTPLATFASYQSGRSRLEAFVEYPQLGQPLPAMPVFLNRSRYVHVPLEETYRRAWEGMPAFWRNVVSEATESQ